MGLTRREAIPVLLLGVPLTITACGRKPEYTPLPSVDTSLIVPAEIEPFIQDLNPDPVYRAATILLFDENGGYGHGSLVQIKEQLVIYTIGHVSDSPSLRAHIPGVGITDPLDPERFYDGPRLTNDIDVASYFFISPEAQALLQQSIDASVITPLELLEGFPAQNELLAIPRTDTGKNSIYAAVGYDPDLNVVITDFTNQGLICAGRSGNPVLKIENGRPTNKLYGTVWGPPPDPSFIVTDPLSGNPNCSVRIWVRPND